MCLIEVLLSYCYSICTVVQASGPVSSRALSAIVYCTAVWGWLTGLWQAGMLQSQYQGPWVIMFLCVCVRVFVFVYICMCMCKLWVRLKLYCLWSLCSSYIHVLLVWMCYIIFSCQGVCQVCQDVQPAHSCPGWRGLHHSQCCTLLVCQFLIVSKNFYQSGFFTGLMKLPYYWTWMSAMNCHIMVHM